MIIYYLDASAWVKRYISEAGSSFVSRLFSDNESLACSTLGPVEVTATLARKRKARAITDAELVDRLERMQDDWRGFYQIPLSGEVLDSALSLAVSEALRGADALHLASAVLLNTFITKQNNQTVFVGSDVDLNEAAERIGLPVIDPNNHSVRFV